VPLPAFCLTKKLQLRIVGHWQVGNPGASVQINYVDQVRQ
jgi:hypothetical protein